MSSRNSPNPAMNMLRSCVLYVAFCALAAPVSAQTVVSDTETCPSCRITTSVITTFGAADGPGSLSGQPFAVRLDGQGNYWVLSPDLAPQVFSPAGRHVLSLGRTGQGPGEYQMARNAVSLPGDSVLVIDIANARATVVSPEYRATRFVRLEGQVFDAVPLAWPERAYTFGIFPSASHLGKPLQISTFASDNSRPGFAFGPGGGEVPPGTITPLVQQLAPGPEGQLWAGELMRYRLSLWSREGTLVKQLVRNPEWFRSGVGPFTTTGSPGVPPSPHLQAVQLDEEGLLWSFSHVPAENWRAAWGGVSGGVAEAASRDIARQYLYDTIIEVIDPARGRVVVRTRISGGVISALPGRRIAVYRESAMGIPFVEVRQLALGGY